MTFAKEIYEQPQVVRSMILILMAIPLFLNLKFNEDDLKNMSELFKLVGLRGMRV